MVKNPPAKAGDARDAGLILGREDPLKKEMATSSSILAWKIPWTEEPGRLQSVESQRGEHNWACPYTCCVVLLKSGYFRISNPKKVRQIKSYFSVRLSDHFIEKNNKFWNISNWLGKCKTDKDHTSTVITLHHRSLILNQCKCRKTPEVSIKWSRTLDLANLNSN